MFSCCYHVVSLLSYIFFLMIRRPPRSTRTDTLFPYTTLFRSIASKLLGNVFAEQEEPPTVTFATKIGDAEPMTHQWTERSEEHTSELQSLMRISYDVFCLKKKTNEKTK